MCCKNNCYGNDYDKCGQDNCYDNEPECGCEQNDCGGYDNNDCGCGDNGCGGYDKNDCGCAQESCTCEPLTERVCCEKLVPVYKYRYVRVCEKKMVRKKTCFTRRVRNGGCNCGC